MCIEKNRTLSQLGAEKIAFPPKSDRQTDISKSSFASKNVNIWQNYDFYMISCA